MNEKTQSIWTRPWTGRSKVIAWLALLTCGIFIVVSSIAAGVAPNAVGWEYAALALIAYVFLAGLAIGGYFFIRWLCCWRNLRKFLFGVACFVTVMALALVEENLRGKHAWQKYRRQLEAEGEKFDLAALLPPEVPAESNLALMPLFKPLFEFTHGKEGIVWGDTNGITRLREISAATPAHGGTYGELILGSVEKGTFADLKQWEAFYRGNTNYPRAAASATPADTVLRALSKFGPELEQLREAAANRPYSRFPIQYGHQPSWEILLPHLSNLKALATLLDVRATSELEIGHAKEAFEDLKLAMRLSDSVRDEPILIDHLVRLAMMANNLQMVREGLIRHAWNDGQLTEIQKYLGSVDLLAEYKLAMRGERALATGGLDYLRRKGLGANPM